MTTSPETFGLSASEQCIFGCLGDTLCVIIFIHCFSYTISIKNIHGVFIDNIQYALRVFIHLIMASKACSGKSLKQWSVVRICGTLTLMWVLSEALGWEEAYGRHLDGQVYMGVGGSLTGRLLPIDPEAEQSGREELGGGAAAATGAGSDGKRQAGDRRKLSQWCRVSLI